MKEVCADRLSTGTEQTEMKNDLYNVCASLYKKGMCFDELVIEIKQYTLRNQLKISGALLLKIANKFFIDVL